MRKHFTFGHRCKLPIYMCIVRLIYVNVSTTYHTILNVYYHKTKIHEIDFHCGYYTYAQIKAISFCDPLLSLDLRSFEWVNN